MYLENHSVFSLYIFFGTRDKYPLKQSPENKCKVYSGITYAKERGNFPCAIMVSYDMIARNKSLIELKE